jgi:hypothetical protein
MLNPVAFPPGRARLSTRPAATGSPTMAMTMGIVRVAFLSVLAGGVPAVTITSTCDLTSSEARSGSRSTRSCPHFHSMATVLPSRYPRSRRPSTNAWVRAAKDVGVPNRRTPIRGTLWDCCARAPSGNAAAAAPSSDRNARRSMPRVPDAVQRATKWSGAPLIRDRHGPERSRVCSASLRFASRCAAPGTR